MPVSVSQEAQLQELLAADLSFHGQPANAATHAIHAFPAKFPPQLASHFIENLTAPEDVVLDPMMGSGTTLVEAYLAGRQAWGLDLDPLARLQAQVKTSPLNPDAARGAGEEALDRARRLLRDDADGLDQRLWERFDAATRRFVGYWFAPRTQRELQALLEGIECSAEEGALRSFLLLAFSSIIITKSGGVTLAFDLAHTRPHRAKVVKDGAGGFFLGRELAEDPNPRVRRLTKSVRSAPEDFGRRLARNVQALKTLPAGGPPTYVGIADAQALPLPSDFADLIVTSPPYAANAIDYMRAHKFSLVWLGHDVGELSRSRRGYIGGETAAGFSFETLPPRSASVAAEISSRDERRGRAVKRYYSEMQRTLGEMLRVLKPGSAAVVVVGNSVIRGKDTETAACLAEIGERAGFPKPVMGVRKLDRDRRLLPAGRRVQPASGIQRRMHQEYVLAFRKPA